MEKIKKSYVCYLLWGRDWNEREVVEREPESVGELMNLDDITCMYFYDQTYIKDGEDIYTGPRKNISPKIHIGQRLSLEEALEITDSQFFKEYVERLIQQRPNVVGICRANHGVTEMYEGDYTLDEYLAEKGNKKKL